MEHDLIAKLEELDTTYAWISQAPDSISNSNIFDQLDSHVGDVMQEVIEELANAGYEPAEQWLRDLDTAENDADFLTESNSIQAAIEWLKNK